MKSKRRTRLRLLSFILIPLCLIIYKNYRNNKEKHEVIPITLESKNTKSELKINKENTPYEELTRE